MRFASLALLGTLGLSIFAAGAAHADKCPSVMILLDRSSSMDDAPDGTFGGTPSKMDIAKKALADLVKKFGTQLPIGLATFSNSGDSCFEGIDVLVPAVDGRASDVLSFLASMDTADFTNTGNAVVTVAKDSSLHDDTRPGAFILLVTDGEPNCGDGTLDDPDYTIKVIGDTAGAGIDTFVVGFGALPTADANTMDKMSVAGGQPCTDTSCGGHMFYAADSQASLDDAITSISQKIVGEFGGSCDDSCYANGCPDGQACVKAACVDNPCYNSTTCAPGSYCFWDGISSNGTCKKACTKDCTSSQTCNNGTCQNDPCAAMTCNSPEVCNNGACITNQCPDDGCDLGLVCVAGKCQDDYCRYVVCPTDSMCVPGSGTCVPKTATSASGGSTGKHGRSSNPGGCAYSTGAGALDMFAMLTMAGLVLALLQRRRRQSRNS